MLHVRQLCYKLIHLSRCEITICWLKMDPCDTWVWFAINTFALAMNCVLMSRTLFCLIASQTLGDVNLKAAPVDMVLWSALTTFLDMTDTHRVNAYKSHAHFTHCFLAAKQQMLFGRKLLLCTILCQLFCQSQCHRLEMVWKKKMFAGIVFTSTLQWWDFEKNVPITDLPNVVGLEKEKNYSRFISYVFDPNVIPSYQWNFNLSNHEEGLKQFSTIWHLSAVKANIPAV